jgi:hypothetical protein
MNGTSMVTQELLGTSILLYERYKIFMDQKPLASSMKA